MILQLMCRRLVTKVIMQFLSRKVTEVILQFMAKRLQLEQNHVIEVCYKSSTSDITRYNH